MIGIQYTIENKTGVSFVINDHTTDPNNFIALQAYPNFDLDIKNAEVNRDGQHGVWDFFSFYGRRAISFQGIIIGSSEARVEAMKEDMQTVLGFPLQPSAGNDGYVYLRWTDVNNNDWELEAKLAASIQFSRPMKEGYRLEFSFTLKAPDPFIYSQDLYTSANLRGYTLSGGQFPLALPAYLGVEYENTIQVDNAGVVDANTVIRLYGEAVGAITNPRVLNLTTGKTFYLSTTLDDETKWVEIDSKLGTVVDQDGNDKSGDIIGDSEFITLVAGNNEVLYLSDEDPLIVLYNPTAAWTLAFRDTKI